MRYVQAFEIAEYVLADRVSRGEQYRPNVLRSAALAAARTKTDADAADAIDRAFYACRVSINLKWDGSIA